MPVTDGPALTDRERRRLIAQAPKGTFFDPFQRLFGSFDDGTVFDYGDWTAQDIAAMIKRDGKSRSTFEVLTLPIRGAHWKFEADDTGDNPERSLKLVEDTLSDRMGKLIDQCTTAIGFAKAFFECSWKASAGTDRDGVAGDPGAGAQDATTIVWDKIDFRPAVGCEAGYDPETGAPRGFRQRVVPVAGYSKPFDTKNPGYVTVKPALSFVYVHGSYREPVKGVSDLDVALWCYETKQKVLFLLFRFLENQSLPATVVYGDDITQAQELAEDVATMKAGSVIGLPRPSDPAGKAFDTIESAGQGAQQFMNTVTYLDSMMVQSVLAGFTELAASPNGSYALSADQSEFFLASRQAVADEIADAIRDAILRPLILNNYGPKASVPKLVIGPLSNRDTDRALNLLTAIVAAPQLNVPGEFVDLLTQGVSSYLGLDPEKVSDFLEEFAVKRKEQDQLKEDQQKALLAQQMAPPPPGAPPGTAPLRGAAAVLSGTGRPSGAQMKQQKANAQATKDKAGKAGKGPAGKAGARPKPATPAKAGPAPQAVALSYAVDAANTLVRRVEAGEDPHAVMIELTEGARPPFRYKHGWIKVGDAPGNAPDSIEAKRGLGTGGGLDDQHGLTRTALDGTPEGEFIAEHRPGLPGDDEVAKDFAAKANLTEAEKAAAVAYQGSFAEHANNAFRTGHPEWINPYGHKVVDQLDAATHAYRTPVPLLLHRGLMSFPEQNVAGKVVTDPGFMSTAFNSYGRSGKVKLNLLAPAGTPGLSMLGAGHDLGEQEFVLPRGTRFLASKDEVTGGIRQITGTILPEEGP